MSQSPTCEIQLLGPVEISSDDASIKISRRVERAILYYLAAEHRPISRTTLIDMLWPDTDNIDQRRALRTALSRLRNELPDPEIILTELDQVWLDSDRCKVDLVIFTALCQSLQSVLKAYQEDQTLPAQIVKQLREALSLWHGDRVIHGDNLSSYPEINAWRRSLDRHLSNQRKMLMKRLADHYLSAGQLQMALDLFIQLGTMDVLDVPIHVNILDILTKLGRHQEALHYCDGLEDAFEQEYNMPLPEPILNRCQYARLQLEISKEKNGDKWTLPLTIKLPLVGRQSELAQLKQAFYRGGLSLLQGEMGSGKTRLVQELYQTLIPKPTLLLAPSREMESALSLSPIIHCLRKHVSDDIWGEINKVWANQLCLLLPELREIHGDCDPSIISNIPSSRQHLFDAIHHVLSLVAEQSEGILFFLDDAQWADHHTLQALSYLYSQGFFNEHGLLVIATRPEEPNRDLNEMLDRFHRYHTVQTITLNGLSPYELGILAGQLMDETPSNTFIDKLYQDTNGNPFVAIEILRDILDMPEELEGLENGRRLPLPESVHALIRRRLNRLDKDSRHILEYAAVIGNSFSLESLHSVVGADHLPYDEIIDPLINSGFIQLTAQEDTQGSNLQFVHEKMREVLLREITPLHLKILHQRVANHLAERPQADVNAAIIAQHYRAGGNISNAFQWLLRAADHAWTLGDQEEALHAYQQAEMLHKNAQEGVFKDEDILKLYYEWSEFAYQASHVEMLEETAIKLQYLGGKENNPLFIGVSHIALAKACFLRSEIDDGLEIIQKAVNNLETTDNQMVLMQAILHRAVFHWWKLQYEEAIASAKRVLKMLQSKDSQSPDLISKKFVAQHAIGSVYYAQGNAKKSLEIARELYHGDFQKLNPFDRIRTLYYLGYAHLLSANYKKSKQYGQKALEIADILNNSFAQELILIIIARAEFTMGQLDQAFEHITLALKIGEKNERVQTVVTANSVLGDIFFALQNYHQATYHYRVAQIRAGFGYDSYYELENNIHLTCLLSWTDQLPEAKQIILKTLQAAEIFGMNQLYAQALIIVGLCDLVERNFSEAEEKFVKAEEIATLNGLKYEIVWSKISRVRVELSRHHFDICEDLLEEILDESRSHNMAWLLLSGLELCGQLHKAKDQPTELLKYQTAFGSLVDEFEKNMQSTPLRGDFQNAKRAWEEGHLYP